MQEIDKVYKIIRNIKSVLARVHLIEIICRVIVAIYSQICCATITHALELEMISRHKRRN